MINRYLSSIKALVLAGLALATTAGAEDPEVSRLNRLNGMENAKVCRQFRDAPTLTGTVYNADYVDYKWGGNEFKPVANAILLVTPSIPTNRFAIFKYNSTYSAVSGWQGDSGLREMCLTQTQGIPITWKKGYRPFDNIATDSLGRAEIRTFFDITKYPIPSKE